MFDGSRVEELNEMVERINAVFKALKNCATLEEVDELVKEECSGVVSFDAAISYTRKKIEKGEHVGRGKTGSKKVKKEKKEEDDYEMDKDTQGEEEEDEESSLEGLASEKEEKDEEGEEGESKKKKKRKRD